MAHYYWVLKCRTAGCGEQLRAEYIGTWGPCQLPSGLWKHPIYLRCHKCREIHRYTFYERRLLETVDPPDLLEA